MNGSTRERLIGIAAFVVPSILYACTAHRFVGFWDTGEMDTVPYILGIAHPPGLPLYTLLGWLFSHLFAFGSVAFRMSLLSALAMGGAAWCVSRIANEFKRAPWAALFAALLFACGTVAWNVATRADVHALLTLLYAAALLAWLRWYRESTPSRLYLAAALLGLAIAAHPVGFFLLPAVLVLVIMRLHEIEYGPLGRASVLALACACAPFLYLPLRSAAVSAFALDPSASLGLPGGAFWDYDHPVVAGNFIELVFARDVDVGSALRGYGSDLFAGGMARFGALCVSELTVPGCLAALGGVLVAIRSQRQRLIPLLVAGAAPAAFAAAFADESDPSRYLLPAFVVLAALAGYGVASLRATRFYALGIAAALAACVLLLSSQLGRLRDAQDATARNQAQAILALTPGNAIVVADWTLAPPLAYEAYVDRRAGSRTILAYWYGEIGNVLPTWPAQRPVFVAGTPEGSVAGFRLERISAYPSLYRVKRASAK